MSDTYWQLLPREFTLGDWKVALGATKDAISAKRIGILAAGIAYFTTLAFPFNSSKCRNSKFHYQPSATTIYYGIN